MNGIVNICIYGSYILVFLCLAAWLGFTIKKLIDDTKSMMNIIIMFGAMFGLFIIGKLIAPDMTEGISARVIESTGIDQSTYSYVNAFYVSSIFGMIVTFALMIYDVVSSAIRK